jgi:proline dehydrogenase
VFSARYLRAMTQTLYTQLVALKQQRAKELAQPDTLENVSMTSERLNKIQQRIGTLEQLPAGIERKAVKDTLKKLNAWKGKKSVQKLLRDYTDGVKAQLETADFVTELVRDTDEKSLILSDGIKPSALSISLSALLLRA